MRKLVAVIKREYTQRVRAKMFIITTILLPVSMLLFGIVPVLVLNIESGHQFRLVVVDGTGKMFVRFRTALLNREMPELDPDPANRGQAVEKESRSFSLEELRAGSSGSKTDELERRLQQNQIDGYLILPPDLMEGGKAQFFRRNTGDFFINRRVHEALDKTVRDQRLIDANVDAKTLDALDDEVDFETTRISKSGQERDESGGMALVFGVGFIMYLSVLLYGQVVLGSVIEEKETRIAEVLFSSVRPFTLMIGKLVGVSLVALTQLAIWALAFVALSLYGIGALRSRGLPTGLPNIPLSVYVYFVLFFLLGYFVYSTLYALVGSIVTTPQEGGQLAMPIVLVLVIAFYFFLPVSRNPDSDFAFWISLVPFFAPIAMLVRIVTQTPPFWQIALSLLIGFLTVAFLTWLTSRIYRIGMLMYGKRASIPEIVRWVRQS